MDEIYQIKKWFWVALIGWVLFMSSSFIWNARQLWQNMLVQEEGKGLVTFSTDLSYRVWNASHGGVYVPVTKETRPNPYLDVPNRDIVTTDGEQLTLINPAYMTRQVFIIANKLHGIQGHLTSLNLLNPVNQADIWEKQCLLAFEQDRSTITQLTTIDGEPVLRFMRPMVTEASCLKCHAHMGYKLDDIRGGISVAIPMAAPIAATKKLILNLAITCFIIFFIGTGALLFSRKKLALYFLSKERAEVALKAAHDKLEQRVIERTVSLKDANKYLQDEIVERQQTEAQLELTLEDLGRANDELQTFSYIVSHDLKAPLRGISSIAQWLSEDYREVLDENGREYLDKLLFRTDWAHNLIEDILQYSRIGKIDVSLQPVECASLFLEVIDTLAPPPAIKVSLDGEFPTINYSELHLHQVAQNLIGNAIKYMGRSEGNGIRLRFKKEKNLVQQYNYLN